MSDMELTAGRETEARAMSEPMTEQEKEKKIAGIRERVGEPYYHCGKWSHSHPQETYTKPDRYGFVYGPCRYVASNLNGDAMFLLAEVDRLLADNDTLRVLLTGALEGRERIEAAMREWFEANRTNDTKRWLAACRRMDTLMGGTWEVTEPPLSEIFQDVDEQEPSA